MTVRPLSNPEGAFVEAAVAVLRVAKRNRARHDDRGNRPKLFEHLMGLLQPSCLCVAGGKIARDCRILRHLLPRSLSKLRGREPGYCPRREFDCRVVGTQWCVHRR